MDFHHAGCENIRSHCAIEAQDAERNSMVRLSERLQMVADLVSVKNSVADIGCDHGYTSLYLAQSAGVRHVIAMDINEGPLERAREHIMQAQMENCMETRLSDGAKALHPQEVEGMVISGMGGALMVKILSESRLVAASLKELIIQPQSEISLVRRYLHQAGFAIAQERMTLDADKFYVAIRAVPGQETYGTDRQAQLYYHYGKCLIQEKNPVLKAFLLRELQRLEPILERLCREQEPGEKTICRMQELSLEKEQIYKVLDML